MNLVDIAILLVLALFLGRGLWRGGVLECCSLTGVGVGLVCASRFTRALAGALEGVSRLDERTAAALVFFALFLVGMVVFALLGFFLGWFGKLPLISGPNRVVGGLLGLVRGVILLALLLAAQAQHPWPKSLGPPLAKASLAPPFVPLGEALYRGGEVLAGRPR